MCYLLFNILPECVGNILLGLSFWGRGRGGGLFGFTLFLIYFDRKYILEAYTEEFIAEKKKSVTMGSISGFVILCVKGCVLQSFCYVTAVG